MERTFVVDVFLKVDYDLDIISDCFVVSHHPHKVEIHQIRHHLHNHYGLRNACCLLIEQK